MNFLAYHYSRMSQFEEKYDEIVATSKNEIIGILNVFHQMSSGYQAFLQICKTHSIKPLRKKKGQYNANKRPLSAYNLFTKEMNKDNAELKKLSFKERSKKIGEMWNEIKDNKKKSKKYYDMAEKLKAEAGNNDKEKEEEPVEEEKEKKKKSKKEPAKKKAPPKKNNKKKKAEEKVADPSEGSGDELYMGDSEEDMLDDSDAEVSD